MVHSRNRFEFETEDDRSASYGTLYTSIGQFDDLVILHGEDEELANDWDSYEFVRYKCQLKYYKAKLRLMKEKLAGMQYVLDNTYKGLLAKYQTDGLIPDDSYDVIKRMRRQVAAYDREVKEFNTKVYNMKNNFPTYVEKTLAKRQEIRDTANKMRTEALK